MIRQSDGWIKSNNSSGQNQREKGEKSKNPRPIRNKSNKIRCAIISTNKLKRKNSNRLTWTRSEKGGEQNRGTWTSSTKGKCWNGGWTLVRTDRSEIYKRSRPTCHTSNRNKNESTGVRPSDDDDNRMASSDGGKIECGET